MSFQQVTTADFEVAIESDAVLSVRGELDVQTAPALRAALDQALVRAVHPSVGGQVVLDLAGMTFIDAIGLGVLAGAARKAHQAGREIVLRNPRASACRILELTGLWEVFAVELASDADAGAHAA